MELDRLACDRARRSRDARFDGRFFIAVTTTGIYCRPICPARAPKDENVRYFPTAAAAEAAGFRPCLRCRPEASPGTPAWLGTSGVVSRALRLIGEGALDETGSSRWPDRLGVTARHLRRLFRQHLGATPLEVALTRRVHFAKKLLDETTLGVEAGRVRVGVRKRAPLQRPDPAHLRANADRAAAAGAAARRRRSRVLSVPPRVSSALRLGRDAGVLGARAIPGVESVEESRYRRTIAVDGRTASSTYRASRTARRSR